MRLFLRKAGEDRDPLVVAMSGVRLGERVLQIGVNDVRAACRTALKVGLSGHAAIVVLDEAARARVAAGAADAGATLDIHVTSPDALPFPDASFDVLVVNGSDGLIASLGNRRAPFLAEAYRVIRPGGRIIAVEPGSPTGLLARFASKASTDSSYSAAGGTTRVLEEAGFKPVRDLADMEGLKFVEGFRR